MASYAGFCRSGLVVVATLLPVIAPAGLMAAVLQESGSASSTTKQMGTVKAIAGDQITLRTDAGQETRVGIAEGAKFFQLAPGSTDLKTAKSAAMRDVAVGDRVLVAGKPGDAANTMTALRVILMKSTDIADRNAAEQADWQKRGSGGVVSAVDAATGMVTITSSGKKVEVKTAPTTKFRRYAGGSVKFEDAKPGTIAEIQPGDQMRVRGDKSENGSSIMAQEVVSGSFKNLAGTIATIDAGKGVVTLKDNASKKMMTVAVTENSDIRKLPEEQAARIAARFRGGAPGEGGQRAGARAAAGVGAPAAGPGTVPAAGPRGGPDPGAGSGNGRAFPGGGSGLSQILQQLPKISLSDLKVGDAVMIVASEANAASTSVTAVTLLTGVGPILSAMPSGSQEMNLSPWNMSGGGGDAGGTQ